MFLGTWELLLIVLLFVLIFGARRIPELMKGLGQGVKSFKDGMSEVEKEINTVDDKSVKKDPETKSEEKK